MDGTNRKKIVVTGFDPFGGEKVNPAYEAVMRLPDEVAGVVVVKKELPTIFWQSAAVLERILKEEMPDAVLCVGQAGGRADISVERVAVNLMDARIADNAGFQPVDDPICAGGAAAYFATVPVKAMVEAIRTEGIPAHVSYSAGTFVCNFILYEALRLAAGQFPGLRCGFIHVPYEPGQVVDKPAGTPSMPVRTITAALEAAVRAVAG